MEDLMEDLIKYAQNVLDAINEEYTGKSQQEEIIRDMYTVTERILEAAKKKSCVRRKYKYI
ncbi:Predicted protein [Listeria monocytogenes]|nr:Predicted protein [Listeria monocytogenes]CUM03931.1 Predicted protein [Listeria monocytogenes]